MRKSITIQVQLIFRNNLEIPGIKKGACFRYADHDVVKEQDNSLSNNKDLQSFSCESNNTENPKLLWRSSE